MSNERSQHNTSLIQSQFSLDSAIKTERQIDISAINDDGILNILNQTCYSFKEQTAIEWNNQQISYSQLNDRTNRLANCLIGNQIAKGSKIAVILDDRSEMIISLIAIWKAGCVFVPLDASFPEERLCQIVDDVSPDCFITQSKFSSLIAQIYRDHQQNSKIINIEETWQSNQFEANLIPISKSLSKFSSEKPSVSVDLEQSSYIYYTSGSTGKPKGIVGNLKGVSHFIKWEIETFNITAGWRFSQFTSPTFDAFLRDIFVPLCSGGTICISPELTARMETKLLIDWIDSNQINLIHCVPSLFATFTNRELDGEKLNSLNYILMSGETLPVSDVENFWKVYSNRIKLVNLYGATETTMVKFYHQVKESDLERGFIPIGKPIKGARAVILDRYGNLCPRGVFGELYIRTPYKTLGYYNQPELTKEVFVSNPFSDDPHDLIYKTGDVARLLNDGNFQLRGRKDDLVKIRGIRVELGDIENQLRQHNLVQGAVVLIREDKPGQKRLVAYVVANPESNLTVAQLRHFLKQRLPDYMMPAAFVILDTLPLLPNGKVNRLALPAPDNTRQEPSSTYVVPQDQLESHLTEIWSEVLGIQPIGVKDNFFDLGGNSLQAVSLFAQIEKQFGKNLPLATLFQSGTVAEIAQIIRSEKWLSPWESLVPIQPNGSKPPLFYIHAGGGNLLVYRDLAFALGVDQPVYGLQPRGLDGKYAPFNDVKDMADYYLAQIRSLQPNGPYFLAGLSTGGATAWEIAQLLQTRGQKVALLALFDSSGPNYYKILPPLPRLLSVLKYVIFNSLRKPSLLSQKLVSNLRQLGLKQTSTKILESLGIVQKVFDEDREINQHKMQSIFQIRFAQYKSVSHNLSSLEKRINSLAIFLLKHFASGFYTNVFLWGLSGSDQSTTDIINDTGEIPEALQQVVEANIMAKRNYMPSVYSDRVILFRASDRPPGFYNDPKLGWGDLAAGGMEIYEVPGNHTSIMKSPILAEKLKICLDKAQVNERN
ncbi:MAG: amino acid adenylation domain-containing protein [Cyanobacteria bacterium P01_G01_bin.39]